MCKTTQSGYEGYLRDQYTLLPETRERLLASSVTCTWRYYSVANAFDEEYEKIREAALTQFFGNPRTGVYSPSVQYTLYQMGKAIIGESTSSVHVIGRRTHRNAPEPNGMHAEGRGRGRGSRAACVVVRGVMC